MLELLSVEPVCGKMRLFSFSREFDVKIGKTAKNVSVPYTRFASILLSE
jgi:hypothetical protein